MPDLTLIELIGERVPKQVIGRPVTWSTPPSGGYLRSNRCKSPQFAQRFLAGHLHPVPTGIVWEGQSRHGGGRWRSGGGLPCARSRYARIVELVN